MTTTRLMLVVSNLGHGGAERQVVELANNLDRSRFDVHVCSLSEHMPQAAFLKPDVALHVVTKRSRFDVTTVNRLARLMKREAIDVVHGFLFDAEIASRLASLLHRSVRVIGSERNSQHNFKRVQLLAYRLTSGLIDVCVANSRAGAAFNQAVFGLPESSYRVVYNGVDTDRFRPEPRSPGGKRQIGMVGSFKRQKNHPYLIDVVSRLARLRDDFRVVLVGSRIHEGDSESDEYYLDVLRRIEAADLSGIVEIREARNDIENFYNECYLTVIPSLFEGTPNVALESLACGVPVLATDVSDNRFVIPDGKVGHIVALDDAESFAGRLDSLLEKPGLRDQFAETARKWVSSEFSIAAMVENMSKVYVEDAST